MAQRSTLVDVPSHGHATAAVRDWRYLPESLHERKRARVWSNCSVERAPFPLRGAARSERCTGEGWREAAALRLRLPSEKKLGNIRCKMEPKVLYPPFHFRGASGLRAFCSWKWVAGKQRESW
eukprot:TRINITY_DN5792_c0_g2_i1.p2 TRINITY_DN5792_c0_g2~~TRINITY_DN5792_c0_g2_i1.p2  ORF type:complete len:123 (-),score=0.24 TRINITY_DN5792_c0_g2_i1:131-499(-)